MIMISGIMETTQYKNITSPQNNLKSPSTNMHKVQQRQSRVLIYKKCEGDDVDLGDDDGDGDEDSSPHAKGAPVEMKVPISLR
jgi:hypothetical protein